jgi:hypothetical protein
VVRSQSLVTGTEQLSLLYYPSKFLHVNEDERTYYCMLRQVGVAVILKESVETLKGRDSEVARAATVWSRRFV